MNFCKLAKYFKPDVCSVLQTVWYTSLPQNKSRNRTLKYTTFVTVFQLCQSNVLRQKRLELLSGEESINYIKTVHVSCNEVGRTVAIGWISSVVKWKIKQKYRHVTVQASRCTDIRYQPLYTCKCDVIVFQFRNVNNLNFDLWCF